MYYTKTYCRLFIVLLKLLIIIYIFKRISIKTTNNKCKIICCYRVNNRSRKLFMSDFQNTHYMNYNFEYWI